MNVWWVRAWVLLAAANTLKRWKCHQATWRISGLELKETDCGDWLKLCSILILTTGLWKQQNVFSSLDILEFYLKSKRCHQGSQHGIVERHWIQRWSSQVTLDEPASLGCNGSVPRAVMWFLHGDQIHAWKCFENFQALYKREMLFKKSFVRHLFCDSVDTLFSLWVFFCFWSTASWESVE